MTNQTSAEMKNTNVLLTGATGGMGVAFSKLLLKKGANLVLIGRDKTKLQQLKDELLASDKSIKNGVINTVKVFVVDLVEAKQRAHLIEYLTTLPFEINLLINNAGINQLSLLEQTSESEVNRIISTNAIAPIQLTQALLPILLKQPCAQIINIGSTFGSIGYPGYSAYCASKFALRGFSETLSRELADTDVSVKYLAPRATNTSLISENIEQLNDALNTHTDLPEVVAKELLSLIKQNKTERYIGWPENIFVRLNALFPAIVGNSIVKQLPIIKTFARVSLR
ncbi:SDR family oxidoreductase [Colwellia psychrerythraea]|uniref:Short-chain dehydrogenase/reductase SDR n=1 Tax=Colwellia psychrerythraea TaxID=28229 RepID=A0A099KTC7_COLPS|nr:SDR family oxidoreductase [Colwellia psychrerythraea]KGJ94019.1 short-chain dehydrogenase/reductase SDR [Colwellia psychrerythraea]